MPPAPALACYALAVVAAAFAVLTAGVAVVTDRVGALTGLVLVAMCLTAGAVLWAIGRVCADVAAVRRATDERRAAPRSEVGGLPP